MAFRNADIYISESKLGGRGVFAGSSIQKGDLIEVAPVIICKESDKALLDQTALYDYYFMWGENEEKTAVALGFGSLYNHSCPANAEFMADYDDNTIDFYALRYIEAGEEITINYNGDPFDESKPWFFTDGRRGS
jgi:hypothetical protein